MAFPIGPALAFGSGILQGFGEGSQRKQDQKLTKAQMIDQALRDAQSEDFGRAQIGLQSTQMDPYSSAKHLMRAQLLRQILGGASPMTGSPERGFQGGIQIPSGGFDVSALTDPNLSSSAGDFYSNRAMVQPNVATPTLGLSPEDRLASENVRQGTSLPQLEANRQRRMQMIMNILGTRDEKRQIGATDMETPSLSELTQQFPAGLRRAPAARRRV